MEPFADQERERRPSLDPGSSAAQPRRSERVTNLAGVTILLLVLFLAAAAAKSFRDLSRAKAREAELQVEIGEAEARIERLRSRIDDLHSDPLVLERLAREDLGLASPEDVVIVLPESTPE